MKLDIESSGLFIGCCTTASSFQRCYLPPERSLPASQPASYSMCSTGRQTQKGDEAAQLQLAQVRSPGAATWTDHGELVASHLATPGGHHSRRCLASSRECTDFTFPAHLTAATTTATATSTATAVTAAKVTKITTQRRHTSATIIVFFLRDRQFISAWRPPGAI